MKTKELLEKLNEVCNSEDKYIMTIDSPFFSRTVAMYYDGENLLAKDEYVGWTTFANWYSLYVINVLDSVVSIRKVDHAMTEEVDKVIDDIIEFGLKIVNESYLECISIHKKIERVTIVLGNDDWSFPIHIEEVISKKVFNAFNRFVCGKIYDKNEIKRMREELHLCR